MQVFVPKQSFRKCAKNSQKPMFFDENPGSLLFAVLRGDFITELGELNKYGVLRVNRRHNIQAMNGLRRKVRCHKIL
jgi:hypothetical protein